MFTNWNALAAITPVAQQCCREHTEQTARDECQMQKNKRGDEDHQKQVETERRKEKEEHQKWRAERRQREEGTRNEEMKEERKKRVSS